MEEKYLHAEEPEAERNSQFLTKNDSNRRAAAKLFTVFNPDLTSNKNGFTAAEKLKSKKIIDLLFKEGKSVSNNGFTLVYLYQTLHTPYPAQAGFSVPKKYFKRAVDRNRIKRLMREVYRTSKIQLYQKLCTEQKQFAFMFVYKGKQIPDFSTTQKALLNCMQRISFK